MKNQRAAKQKQVIFRLVDKIEQKTKDGIQVKTWGICEIMSNGHYKVRDENLNLIPKQLVTSTTIHPKTGMEMKVGINGLQFISGEMVLNEGRDNHLIKAMRECVNNRDAVNRDESDKVIYYEVNEVEERLASVSDQDKIFEAYTAIKNAEPNVLIEYAKALGGIDVHELEIMKTQTTGKKKDIKETDQYKLLEKEMKAVAAKNATTFLINFSNPLSQFLAAINQGIELKVLSYMESAREFAWIMGNSKHVIVQVPVGVVEAKNWFASWLISQEETFQELVNRNTAALNV